MTASLETTPVELRIAFRDPLDVDLPDPPRSQICPRCGWKRSHHGPGQWDECRDLLSHQNAASARREREREARETRRLCPVCGNVHGPGGCP